MNILLSPPVAILIYIPLVLVLVWLGKRLAGPERANAVKSSVYGSGEESPDGAAQPGYRPFILIAFFFAILHLGVLVVGSGSITMGPAIYLAGLVVALVALILG